MNAEQRFEALAIADATALEALADQILATGASVSVTNAPESVSAPVRIPGPGPAEASVVLGHVALTRCSVLLGGTRGDAVRCGFDLPGAVAAAVCDAERERDGALSAEVDALCKSALAAAANRQRARADLVAMTRLADEP